MSGNPRSLAKQLHRCLGNLKSFTDGQVCMKDCDWEEMKFVTFDIKPNDGHYKGAVFTFQVSTLFTCRSEHINLSIITEIIVRGVFISALPVCFY